MTEHGSNKRTEHPSATPGRPKESGSRQQKHPDQGSESGAGGLDKRASDGRGRPVPAKPPGAK
jgi:hypothetical protein